jgi:peptidoglycan/LPS O-acetylase OafA/YrhL
MQRAAPISNQYIPKLDGLRAISIGLVLIEHFLWTGHGLGSLGVTIFFVISGYLITSILISYDQKMSVRNAAIKFYWRRSLRLFPTYYLTIAICLFFNLAGMRSLWIWSCLYLMNVKVALDGHWNNASHFWSLAIEEQFYIFWFFVVVVISRRFLPWIIGFCLVAAPTFRGVMWITGANTFSRLWLPGVMDSLATGGLLAYVVLIEKESAAWEVFLKLRWPLLIISFCTFVAGDLITNSFFSAVLSGCVVNLLAICAVTLSLDESDSRTHWLGGLRIRHIGKISYGIYVYHYFVPQLLDSRLRLGWLHSYTGAVILRFLILVGISIGIAELSWLLIEKPILGLKGKFPLSPVMKEQAASIVER